MFIRSVMLSLALTLAACGSATHAHGDAGPPADLNVSDLNVSDLNPTEDLRISIEGKVCKTRDDCSDSDVCAFKIGAGCGTIGHCAAFAVPTCAHESYLCGCDGKVVNDSDCYYAAGYASGPSNGGPQVGSDQVCGGDGGV